MFTTCSQFPLNSFQGYGNLEVGIHLGRYLRLYSLTFPGDYPLQHSSLTVLQFRLSITVVLHKCHLSQKFKLALLSKMLFNSCQVIYSQFGLAIHQNDHKARRRFVEWVQNEIAVVPDFHKRILFSDEAHIWLNGYVNKQNCRIWSEANPQVYVETPLHPEKLTVWWAVWAGGILLQKR
ncbi:transposase [Trichonephila clavipes]|nr:transposase [Trichonephila clavipes]